MKKTVLAALVIISCCLFSCGKKESGGMSDKAKKNMETADAIIKMLQTGDNSKIGDYISTDAVDHSAPTGELKGLDAIKAEFNDMSKMMSDFNYSVTKEIADDDYVFQWGKESWTMKTDGMGMKAGDKVSADFIEVSKMTADSKASDHWSFISVNDMMKMMPPPSNMKDSSMNKMMEKKK